jgi:sugar fermentation stimulation protein A
VALPVAYFCYRPGFVTLLGDRMSNQEALQFGPTRKARFIERPNRFLVRCRLPRVDIVDAYLANSGRLSELLLPGAKLHLVDVSPSSNRRTHYEVIAVECDGRPVFVDTHRTNDVARFLIAENRIAELAGAEVTRSEVRLGRCRFDFLLRKNGRDVYLEVKSCTLFGNEVAMFPDAVTERGRRHLIELGNHTRRADAAVLFLVHTPNVRWFMPDYHTDLAFSESLLKARSRVQILPVALDWRPDLSLGSEVKPLEVPWGYLKREVRDRGSYILVLRLKTGKRVHAGRLGGLCFRRGYYLYVGSAVRNLSARIARHARFRKKLHWHIDYLRDAADGFVPLPIRSSRRDECAIAAELSNTYAGGPRAFGSSDCNCMTHLFFSPRNPLEQSTFHKLLQGFRMRPPYS